MTGQMRRAGVVVVATAACCLGVALVPAGQVAVAGPVRAEAAAAAVAVSGPVTASAPAQASALASSSGRSVEVLGDRTDWAQTFAMPGGGFKTVESLVPVRVRRPGGSWGPVDTALSVRPDGSVAPGAITVGLRLSGGGPGPLYTLSSGADWLSASWPYGPLPAPSLSGATATYHNVLPGVNLLVTAVPTGVSELVEVTSAAAAANRKLARITFPVSGHGLAVTADARGELTAADAAGRAVFGAPAPRMWDSGDHAARLGVDVGARSLSLVPASSVLSGPSVTYPVFIDPTWTGQQSGATWLDVWKDSQGQVGGDWEPTAPTFGGIRSGVCDSTSPYCNTADSAPLAIFRSYINFTLPGGYSGSAPDYVDAQLQITESWAWSCTGSTLELWRTAHADKGIDWNSRPQQITKLAWPDIAHKVGQSGSCNQATVLMDATPALTAAGAAGYGANTVTFELRGSDLAESNWDPNSWKRFLANTMDLVVYWRHKPDVPTGAGTQGMFHATTGQAGTSCAPGASAPDWVNTTAPVVQAAIDDSADRTYYQNNGQSSAVESLDGEFSWQNLTTGGSSGTTPLAASNNPSAPQSKFTGLFPGSAGDEYSWQAYGTTLPNVSTGINKDTAPVLTGPSSAACYFQIDTTGPSAAPAVTGPTSLAVGKQGTFTFTAGASDAGVNGAGTVNDVAGFRYSVDSSQPAQYIRAATIGSSASSASITLAPLNTKELDLYVQAVDRAGNPGPVAGPYRITPASSGNIVTLAYWKLTDATDSASGADLTLAPGASFTCGPAPPSGLSPCLTLNGSGGQADTSRPVMGNDASFSVSAWVNPAGCGFTLCAVMSQDGSNVSAFILGYQSSGCPGGTSPCWVFEMPAQDSGGAAVNVAAAPAPAAAGKWTQLTGVFSATHGQLLLYLNGGDGTTAGNGSPAATAAASPWASPGTGVFRLGAGWASSGGAAGFFNGSVSDACVFYGVLQTSAAEPDVQNLYHNGSGDGCATLAAAYP
jgi:hypothetical protein